MEQIMSKIFDLVNLLNILMWLLAYYWAFEDHDGKP